ncbi:MAG: hemin receptor [Chloroflexi bacterium]|nr:hemin receptor [Chloroflexota bacterium]
MTLTNNQKAIVQTTFGQVTDADLLANRFYNRLFEIDPSTQSLFKHDMAEQRQKLIQTIGVVVNNLGDLSTIVPAIQSLGKRHVAYGVTINHWDSVGNALLWALEDAFGPAFTPDIRHAWASAYGLIAQTAIAAAYATSEESNN